MIFTPTDIACFLYCPMLPKGSEYLVYEKSTVFESCVGNAIVEAERGCLLNDSEINPRMINKAWDNTWWPVCATHKIPFKKAQDKTVKAGPYFLDYCKYDISDFLHPTVAVDIDVQVPVGQSVLHAHVDLMKVDLTVSNKNMMLIDFSKKGMKTFDAGLDPGIAATAMAFHRGVKETIQYVLVEVDENTEKLFVTSAVFRPSDIENIKKMISYVENSMRNGVSYGNRWKCKECKACPSFKYLMKEDSLLRQ